MDQRERSHKILEAIILSYAESGIPVGSVYLLGRHPFRVSSATVRNIMAELEEQGLITHPHTSSGRVPTDRGYRYYVDLLMQTGRVTPEEERAIRSLEDSNEGGMEETLTEAARLLSDLTKEAGIALVPQLSRGSFGRLEFIWVEPGELFGVLISNEGFVKHARISVRPPFPADRLVEIESMLNGELSGLSLTQAREAVRKITEDWVSERGEEMDLSGLEALFREEPAVILEGASWILEAPEFRDIDRTRRLIRGLENRRELAHLLERDLSADGVRVHIGAENRETSLTDCSVMAAPYRMSAEVSGTVGVVGPTRMHYPKVASLVSRMAQTLTRVFQGWSR